MRKLTISLDARRREPREQLLGALAVAPIEILRGVDRKGTSFGGIPKGPAETCRSSSAIACFHDTYRSITTSYDVVQRVLVYYWTCERCGAHLSELRRRSYEPRYKEIEEIPVRRAAAS